MNKFEKQMVIDHLTSAALVSSMREIEFDGQKLTRSDQQAVVIDLINRALIILNENKLIPFLENSDVQKPKTNFLIRLAKNSFNNIKNNEE